MSKKFLLIVGILLFSIGGFGQSVTLLNVSYDPTRELYQDYNAAFSRHWKAKTGQDGNQEGLAGSSEIRTEWFIKCLAAVIAVALSDV